MLLIFSFQLLFSVIPWLKQSDFQISILTRYILTAIFPGGPGLTGTRCLHSGFVGSKGDGGGVGNWNY